MRWPLVAALAVALTSLPAAAHVNVESTRREITQKPFSALVDFRFGFTQGNVNTLSFALQDRFAVHHGRHLLFLFNESGFAARTLARDGQGVTDLPTERYQNAHLGHLRYSLRIVKFLAAEAFTQLQMNEFLVLRTRLLLGLTPRFTIFENQQFGVFAGAGYIAEYEQLDERFFVAQPGGYGSTNWWHRFGAMVAMSLRASERLEIHTTTYAQPRFDAWGDLRVFNQAELEVDIVEHFSIKLVATIAHDTRPPLLCRTELAPGDTCAATDDWRLLPTDVSLANALSIEW